MRLQMPHLSDLALRETLGAALKQRQIDNKMRRQAKILNGSKKRRKNELKNKNLLNGIESNNAIPSTSKRGKSMKRSRQCEGRHNYRHVNCALSSICKILLISLSA